MSFSNFFQQYLKEDSIENFELKGNWSDKGRRRGYDKASIGILKNPNGVEKIKKLWNKLDYPVDMYMVRSAHGAKYVELGEVDEDFVYENLKLNIPIDQDHITIIYTNNKGNEKMPMTAWTLAHRFGHALARGKNSNNVYHKALVRAVDDLLEELAERVYRQTIKTKYGVYDRGHTQKIKLALCHALGTFKSARDKNIRDSNEFINELVAEFIITDDIKFNKELPEILTTRYNWGKPEGAYKQKRDAEFNEDISNLITNKQDEIYSDINALIGGSVGSIFVM